MKLRYALVAILFAAACTTKQNASIFVSKIVPPKVVANNTTVPPSFACEVDPGDIEFFYLPFNPAENAGNVGLVIANRVPDTSAVNPDLRLDTSRFSAHQAVIDYEVLAAGATSPGRQVMPMTGTVEGGGELAIPTPLFPKPSDFATLADGTYVRVTFRVEGKLGDGAVVSSAEHEYIFQVCTAAGCAGNPCL